MTAMPDLKSAKKLATRIVQKKIAACVSVVPGVFSVYRWKDKLETAGEALVLIKTSAGSWPAAQKLILSLHPYDLPELLVLPVKAGSKKYLEWMSASLVRQKARRTKFA